ncbi:MAG TPA: hypothetical protein VM925_27580 [Labilithrix sp.]|jgi:uncharacterized protein Yka (UPF0111/DUF47 family)|nr:hypothetical protein [Labilithrix sp.]
MTVAVPRFSTDAGVRSRISRWHRMLRFFGEGDRLYELLERQAALVHDGAATFLSFATGAASMFELQPAADGIEAEEERVSTEIETALARALLARIDREDMHELSSRLHTSLSFSIYSLRSNVTLSGDEPAEAMSDLARTVVDCTALIAQSIRRLRHGEYGAVPELAREIRSLHRGGIEMHDAGLSSLLRHDGTGGGHELVRTTFALDAVEGTLRQCGRIGSLLAYLAVKHG